MAIITSFSCSGYDLREASSLFSSILREASLTCSIVTLSDCCLSANSPDTRSKSIALLASPCSPPARAAQRFNAGSSTEFSIKDSLILSFRIFLICSTLEIVFTNYNVEQIKKIH